MFLSFCFYFVFIFFCALLGILLSRMDILFLLMSMEVLLVLVNILFVLLSFYFFSIVGYVSCFFLFVLGAVETSIGLSFVVAYRHALY